MAIVCPGCGQSFKTTGIKNHIRQSDNPRCKNRQSLKGDEENSKSESMPACPNEVHGIEIPTDPSGDLFGDYDFTDTETQPCRSSQSESSDSEDEWAASDEGAIEAPRELIQDTTTPRSHVTCPNESDAQGPQTDTTRIRGEAEEVLRSRPFVVHYPTASGGGRVYAAHGNAWTNEAYEKEVKTADIKEIYAPFSSELEWDIAQWAKKRGPSSTALTELLQIKGVSIIAIFQ
jgi:hypothetical protein